MQGFSKVILVLLILVFSTNSYSQEKGSVAGNIIDSNTGDALISATLVIKDGSGKILGGAQSKFDGSFLIKNIPAGTYTLTASFISYQTKVIEGIEVKSGEIFKIDVELAEDAIMMEEVVVTARKETNTGAAMLKERQKAASAQDAISEEEISKKGAGDAGEALKKVTGVTIKDNKNVVVRGLSNRYAKTQLNGAALPSSDPDSRSVDLDMFNTGMIENIVTIKTATPDKPGDFTGGAVDIKTKSYPDEFFVTLGLSSAYNFQVTGNDALIGERGQYDFLGFDDGDRALSPEIDRIVDKYGGIVPNANGIFSQGKGTTANNVGKDQGGNDLRQFYTGEERIHDLDQGAIAIGDLSMAPVNVTAPLNTGISFGIGNQYTIGKSTPIGFTANLNYNRNYNSYEDGIFAIWELTSFRDDSLNIIDYFSDRMGEENVLLGGMFNATTTLFDFNEIGFNFIYNQASTNTGRFITGRRPGSSGLPSKGFSSWSNRFIERNLYTYQVNGKHQLNFLENIGLEKTKIDWQVSSSQNNRSVPNFRLFAYEWNPENVDDVFNGVPDVDTVNTAEGRLYDPEIDGPYDPSRDSLDITAANYGINISNYDQPARIFRDMTENNLNISANIEIPLDEHIGIPFSIKTGTLIERIDRSFEEFWITYNPSQNTLWDEDLQGEGYYYNPGENPNSIFERLVGVGVDGNFYDPYITMGYQPPQANSYNATQNVNAFYGMVDFKLFDDKLRVITGVRFENSELLALPLDTSFQTLQRFRGEYALVNGLESDDPFLDSLFFEDFGINENDVLPSLNLVYSLNKETNLRAAYYKTLARPNMREMAPYSAFDFIGGFLINGNPFLERVLIDNYDLRWEWFPNIGELIGVSVYYKSFINPIERGIVSANAQIRYLNAADARLFGAEFEIRKNIGNIIEDFGGSSPQFFKYLDFSFNLTLTEAEVGIPSNSRDAQALLDNRQDILNFNREQDSLRIVEAGGTDFSDLPGTTVDTNDVLKRDFVGQSPYVVNFDVSYSNPELGLNISSNFNVFGRRLDFVQLGRNPDVYELPRPDLNFIISKRFFENLTVKFTANNLLNPYTHLVQSHNGVDYSSTRFRRGRAVALSVAYKF